ncbi:MAG: hypothetical protein JST43_00985 [Bacteroidetes bacterium]|nr:hypothetical protein [Bacteroidota bacterium]MBS1540667.1 hypothetical protein [Bacteroidota bacterium]
MPDSVTYWHTYLSTICLQDSLQTIFLVLLKHYPSGKIDSRILFFDKLTKEFADKNFEFNLSALYNYHNGWLTSTNLKIDWHIDTPEIAIVDFNQDRANDYQLKRLLHNGTFNAIQTTIVTIKKLSYQHIIFL